MAVRQGHFNKASGKAPKATAKGASASGIDFSRSAEDTAYWGQAIANATEGNPENWNSPGAKGRATVSKIYDHLDAASSKTGYEQDFFQYAKTRAADIKERAKPTPVRPATSSGRSVNAAEKKYTKYLRHSMGLAA